LGKDNDKDDASGSNNSNSFDFLGFTHYIGKDKNNKKRVQLKC